MTGPIAAVRRVWTALPIDGRGFLAPADPDAARLIAIATRRRLHMVPPALRPLLIAATRVLWSVKAIWAVRRAARKFGFGPGEALRQYADACLFGLRPKDSYVWRSTLDTPRPLSSMAFWQIQGAVEVPGERQRLGDKLVAAAALGHLPVLVPKLLAVIPAGTVEPRLPADTDMFVKPCNGSRGRNAFSISRMGPGAYWIDGARRDEAYTVARLREAAADDALVVQKRLTGVAELADLSTGDGAPPIVRIITAREPDGEPVLHSAWFAIAVPGEKAAHPLRDAVRVPVAIATGQLLAGYWMGEPHRRLERSSWHQAPIAGRILPGFAAAADAAIAAAQGFPGLPLIGWDLILTDDGPVILEGNSNIDWMFICWIAEGAPDAVPILPLLLRWAAAGPFDAAGARAETPTMA